MTEKRFVTVLYADISGFTKLTSEIGAEKTTDFINECFNVIDSIIHNHYGTIIRHEGDRVLAIFGFPRSYGNDSSNALQSALKIKDIVKKMRYKIDIHIGVGTGDVLISDKDVYGYLLDEVSHLEENAEKGEIVVNRDCYELNKGLFLFEKYKEGYKIKDILIATAPVFYFEFRNKEFEKFKKALSKMPKFIIISGEKGIGKSAFINESVNKVNVEDIFNIYETTFMEYDYIAPYSPLMKVVCQIMPDFKLLPGDENHRIKMYREISSVIFQHARIKPIIVIFKNIEFADEVSIGFLKFFSNVGDRSSVVMIIESHDLTCPAIKEIKNINGSDIEHIELEPLPDSAIIQIISHHLKDYILTENFNNSVCALCRGNPHYAVELSTLIKNSFPKGMALKELPQSKRLKEIAEALIDNTPKRYFDELYTLSLLNDRIEYQIFSRLVPNPDEFLNYSINSGLLSNRDGWISFNSDTLRNFIRERLTKKACRDDHLKIADTFKKHSNQKENYGVIAFHLKEAGEYNEAYIFFKNWAEYLEKELQYDRCIAVYEKIMSLLSDEKIEEKCEILLKKADLLHLTGEREEELKTIEELCELAPHLGSSDYCRKAFFARARYLEAIADYDGALEILNKLNEEKKDALILEKIGINYYNKNELFQALKIFNTALDFLKMSDNYLLIGNILKDMGLCYWKLGDKDQALLSYKKARSFYEKIPSLNAISRLNVNIANVYYYLNKFELALTYYKEALDIAYKIGDSLFVSQILSNIGAIFVQFGDYEEALKNFETALEIDQKKLNKKGEAIRLSNIGNIYGLLGDFEKALKYFSQALKIDEAIRNQTGIAIRYGNIANCLLQKGDYDEAIRYLKGALEISKEVGSKEYLAYYYRLLGIACLSINDFDEAFINLNQGLSMSREVKNPSYEILAQSDLALLFLKKGDIKKAHQHSTWAVDRLFSIQEIEGRKEQVFYTHYKILSQLNRPQEAYRFLKLAYENLVSQAQKIKNLEYRKSFLNQSQNREILELWKENEKKELNPV